MLDDKKKPVLGSKAQEMLMQDILESTQELVNLLGYDAKPCDFEIIAIDPPPAMESDSSNIVCYQTEKQRRTDKRRA